MSKHAKKEVLGYIEARDLLLEKVLPVNTENAPLELCSGRILADDLIAASNIPPFDRSPYDGYALLAADTKGIDAEHPVTLKILEEVPAGYVGKCSVTKGTAVKVLTGSPLPEGADAFVPFEDTRFTDETVTIFAPVKPGSNVVRAGEDVMAGTQLAERGARIDSGLMGTLAGQNITSPRVFKKPTVGIICTGPELVEPGSPLEPGKIYNSSRYALTAALTEAGTIPEFIGSVGDDAKAIMELIQAGIERCDALVVTGGVSVGDYDLTPEAMEMAGVQILFSGVRMKPGMACCYGMAGRIPVIGLSGNPASAMTNYYAVALPAIKKLCGLKDCLPQEMELSLADGFSKKSRGTRLLRGRIGIKDGMLQLSLSEDQGNVVISSLIGCDAMAVVPAGSGPLPVGTRLNGFLL